MGDAVRTAGGTVFRQLTWCIRTALLIGLIPVCSCDVVLTPSTGGAYSILVERGTRHTTTGDRVAYDLFIPQEQQEFPAPPFPGVVLIHGFARSKYNHGHNALFLAERGIVVLTPNMTSLLGGEQARLHNIENLVDHIAWLRERTETEGDPLSEVLDPARIGLAGHSAGGAVSFEAAIDAFESPARAAGVCLLDAVPWARTLDRAADFPHIDLASFRSEPAACNANGEVLVLLENLPFQTDDVLVVGGTHCDPENPTDLACPFACGASSERARLLYRQLLYAFMRDVLEAPVLEDGSESFADTLDRLEDEGKIVSTEVGAADDSVKSPERVGGLLR